MDYRLDRYISEADINDTVAPKPDLLNENGVIYVGEPMDVYGTQMQFHFANLRGTIDGKDYQLMYTNTIMNEEAYGTATVELVPLFPVNYWGYTYDIESELGQQEGTDLLTGKANKLVEHMGYSDFVMTKKEDRVVVVDEGAKKYYDGVVCRFVRKMPELTNSGIESAYIEENFVDEASYKLYAQEYIEVALNQNGDILDIDLRTPYQINETLTDQLKLLPLDTVLDSVENYYGNIPDTDGIWERYYNNKVDTIRLSYIPLEYENQYVYMPAWVFCQNDDMGNEYGMIAVNAVDGTLYFVEEVHSSYVSFAR